MMEKGYAVGGRYRIIREIGEGGMSIVYLAHDPILDRDVAVKILKYDLQNNPETTRRFEREAMAISELSHQNIVSIYDVGSDHGMQYLVMEYVDGTNLKEYIRDNFPLPLERTQQIMEQILSAVAQAHSMGIIHRDLKPLNILIDQDGNIKISDFGIAMALNDEGMTQTNSVLGTVHYLSPEQARGAQATKQSDIYSLGIILYELLTGSVPFVGETPVSVAIKHSSNELPSVREKDPSIPQSFENVITRATAKDPNDRYGSVEDMKEDVSSVLDPIRRNEPKLVIHHDNTEETRLMPVHPVSVIDDDDLLKMPEGGILPSEDEPKKTKKPKKSWSKRKKITLIAASVLAALVLLLIIVLLLNHKSNVKVPDVTGLSENQATEILKKKKLVISPDVEKVVSSKVPKGKIVKTDPPLDSNIKEGSTVRLYVSSGGPTYKIENYTSQSFKDVKEMLERRKIKAISKQEFSSKYKEGVIFRQSIKPGKEVSEGTTITLTVSKGEKKVSMIDLTGYSRKGVTDFANDNGLKKIEDPAQYSNDYDKNTVMAQTPARKTKLSKGSEFHVTFSLGPKPAETTSSSSSSSAQSSSASSKQQNEGNNENTVSFSVNIIIPFQDNSDGETTDGNANPAQNDVKVYLSDSTRKITDLYTEIKIKKDTQLTLPFTVSKGDKGQYRVVSDGKVIMNQTVSAP